MAKRRTRKQKENVKHPNTFSWQPALKNSSPQALVKGELQNTNIKNKFKPVEQENANLLAKEINVPEVRKDIIRSLLVTSFILASELMIYLAWNK